MTTRTRQTADLSETVAEAAKDLKGSARDVVERKAHVAKDAAVEKADQFAAAAEAAERQFDPSSMQAEALRVASEQISDAMDHIRNKPVDELIDDAALFAKRNPLLVLGGAALAGFAAARFFKAGGNKTERWTSTDPWKGHLERPSMESEVRQ
jgi:hypothetical protein